MDMGGICRLAGIYSGALFFMAWDTRVSLVTGGWLFILTRWLVRGVLGLLYRVEIQGLEHVPAQGKLVLCSNHSAWIDPFFYYGFFPRQPLFMGKDSAFANPLIAFYLSRLGVFPVARGQRDEMAQQRALAVLEAGEVLGMFPEGTRVRGLQRVKAKRGTGFFAVTADAPVIPMVLISSFRPFSKIQCKIGQPYRIDKARYQPLDNDQYHQISDEILQAIYGLRDELLGRQGAAVRPDPL